MELSPDDEEFLSDLLLEWEDSLDSRVPRTAEDLCGQRSDLVVELSRRIRELDAMDRLMVDLSAKTRLMNASEFEQFLAPDCPTIPGFRVLGVIGRGGMGVVYKAIQLTLNRPVALKLINNLSVNPQALIARLRNEADALGRLNLEHVIRVFDVIDRRGMPCLVLEYVDGGNLAQRDPRSSIDSESAARIALTVARTMSEVHAKGLLHRDLKPANLLKDAKGKIKISDFGLAKHLVPNSMASVTTEGIGSPSYMAPEQAIGVSQNIGVWTDVYGIGATLYDLITGRPPFLGATPLATMEQVRNNDPVSPRLLVPEIPIDLETICLKCLAKEPQNRYPDASELAMDLDNFLAGQPISARPLGPIAQTWRWSRRHPDRAGLISAILVGFVMSVGLGAWEITRINNAANELRAQKRERDDALVQGQIKEFYLSMSEISGRSLRTPTGWSWTNLDALKQIAPLRPEDDLEALYRLRSEATKALTAFDARKLRELLHGFDPYSIEFSLDGSILAVGANADDNGVVNVALLDTSTWEITQKIQFDADPQWVKDQPDGIRSLLFSPDSTELLIGCRSGKLCVYNLKSNLLVRQWKAHSNYVNRMCYSSDLQSLITCSKDQTVRKWSLLGQMLAEVKHDCELTDLAVLKDADFGLPPHIVVAGGKALWLRESDLRIEQPSEKDREHWSHGFDVVATYPDREGWLRNFGTWFEALDSRNPRFLRRFTDQRAHSTTTLEQHSLEISSDCNWLVSSDSEALKIWDLSAGDRAVLIPSGGRGRVVGRFHPKLNLLAITGEGNLTIYQLSSRELWMAQVPQAANIDRMSLSPDGQRFAASKRLRMPIGDESVIQLCMTTANQKSTARALSTHNGGIQYSPDSSEVCYSQNNEDLAILTAGGEEHVVLDSDLPSHADIARFSPDGKKLYFSAKTVGAVLDSQTRDVGELRVLDIATQTCRTLFSNSESERLLRVSTICSFAVGSRLITCSSIDGSVRILDPEIGSVLAKIVLPSIPDSVTLSPDESSIIAGTRNGDLIVIDCSSSAIRQTIHPHLGAVTAVNFAGPDLVVSCSRDCDLKIWQMSNDGTLSGLLELGPLSDQARELSASDDGNTVAVLVEDETAVRVLRVDLLRQRLADLGLDW